MINRSFLKWAGGKSHIIAEIKKYLPTGNRLIEPFVGAGNVFINTGYPAYLLNDVNRDLIEGYRLLQHAPDSFIKDLREFFTPANNTADAYYRLRNSFNALGSEHAIQPASRWFRALLFVYLNRHCFNGVCRYNQRGGFNVPYGKYKKPYFPEAELWRFAERLQGVPLTCGDFADAIAKAGFDDVVYCDPPYIPVSKSASFTEYATGGFTECDHQRLADALKAAVERGAHILLSNSDTPTTRRLFPSLFFRHIQITARRTIAANGDRQPANELLMIGVFTPPPPIDAIVWRGVDLARTADLVQGGV